MKRKVLLLAVAALVAIPSIALSSSKGSKTNALEDSIFVKALQSSTGLTTDQTWNDVDKIALNGANEGYVSFATIGTNFFFKMYVKDDTKRTGADKIDFEFEVDGKHQGQQGNFDPWLTALGAMDFGNNIQTKLSYDDNVKAYTAVIGFNLGTSFTEGAKVSAKVHYHDAGESQAWGEGDASIFEGELQLEKKDYVIHETDGTNGLTTQDDWRGLTQYPLTGANEGYVQFAVVGTNLFFKMYVKDETKRTGADKIDFEFEVDGKHQGQQGNFDPWLTALGAMDFGNNVQTELSYDDDAKAYTAVIGFTLGTSMVKGSEVGVKVHYHDAGESLAWGEGGASIFENSLLLLGEAEDEPIANTFVIPSVDASTGLMTAENWEGVEKYSLTGANEGYVQFAVVGTNLFFKMYVKDETKRTGADKIDFEFEVDGKHQGQQGNFDPWLTGLGAMDFGNNVQTELSYDDTAKAYTAVIGFQLGDSMVKGNEVGVKIHYHDAGESLSWGQGEASIFEDSLLLLGEAEEEPIVNTYVIPSVEASTGLMAAENWEGVEKYLLTGANEGYVQFAVVGTNLFFKMYVKDETKRTGADKIDFEFEVDGKHQGQQGNFDPWLTGLGAMDFGNNVQTELSYDDTVKAYTAVIGFQLGDSMVKGNEVGVKIHYHDAGESLAWGEGEASIFENSLLLLGEAEEEPEPIINTYVIPAVEASTGLMAAENWEGVEKYLLTGANEGYVQFAVVGTNLFFKMYVKDDTKRTGADKIDFEFEVDGKHQGQQGNFDPWLTGLGAMDFGNNVQTELSYDDAAKAYTAVIGFQLGESMVQGSTVGVKVHYHDAGESLAWGEGEASIFENELKLISKKPIKENTYVIPVVPIGGDGLVTDSSWANVESYDLVGENEGEIYFGYNGTVFFIKFVVDDTTNLSGKERIAYEFEIAGKHQGQQGNFDPWLTGLGAMDFGQTVQLEMYYSQENSGYVAVLAYDLKDALTLGESINFKLTYQDARESSVEWGNGLLSSFEGTLYFGEKHTHTYSTDWSYDETNHWHAANCGHSLTTDVAAHSWNSGEVSIEATEEKDGLRIYTCEVCGATKEEVITALGHTHKFSEEWSTDETHHWHDATCNHNEVSEYGEHQFGEWTVTSTAQPKQPGQKERTCEICGYTETETVYYKEGQVAGPENQDLGIVVVDLANMPAGAEWDDLTSYELIPIYGDTYGATATLKVCSANENIFFKLNVNDEAIHCNADGLYIYIASYVDGEEKILYQARGNFEQWLATIVNEAGSPSLFTQTASVSDTLSYLPGTLEFSQGFYLKDVVVPDNKLHLVIKFRDSRMASETWKDGDYLHTLVFDQVLTFGPKVDRTVRPQTEVNESFTGTASEISYNKGQINWDALDGADSYRLYLYRVNEDGDEPYTHLSVEGPFYDETSYSEVLFGLDELTDYVVQIVAYDVQEKVLAYSPLVPLNTISKQQAMEQQDDSSQGSEQPSEEQSETHSEQPSVEPQSSTPTSEESSQPEPSKKKGCGGMVSPSIFGLLGITGILVALKRKRR